MNLPPEITENFLSNLGMEDLVSACLSNSNYYQICQTPGFWRDRFRKENLPLITEGISVKDWIDEYQRIKEALQAKDMILRYRPDAGVVTISVSDQLSPDMFPDYAQPELIDAVPGRMFLSLERNELDYVGSDWFHEVKVTPVQAEELLFLFFYWNLDPSDQHGHRLNADRRRLWF